MDKKRRLQVYCIELAAIFVLFSTGAAGAAETPAPSVAVAGGAPAAVGANVSKMPYTAKIIGDAINIRSGPGQNFESINKLDADTLVLVEEQIQEWVKIKLPRNSSAFINQSFLSRSAAQPGLGVVTSNRVNIRAGAGTTFNVVGQLNKNDPVEILAEQGEWLHIFPWKNCYGWVHVKFIAPFGKPELYLAEEENESKRFLSAQANANVAPIVPPPAVPAKQEPGDATATRDDLPAGKQQSKPVAQSSTSGETDKAEKKQRQDETAQTIVIEGKILELGRFFQRYGTHKLLQNKKTTHYLRSDTINLNQYIYAQVQITGNVTHPKKSKYPIVSVEQITVLPSR